MARTDYLLKLGVAGVLVSMSGFGCGSAKTAPDLAASSIPQLRTIGIAYAKATTELDRPPQNKEELMLYLKDLAKGYDNPADVLRSKVDDEDFVIHYGVDFREVTGKDTDMPVLAYEKHGKDGKRAVLLYRFPYLKTDEDFANCKFPPGYKSPL
jgi:hypothetical protein